MNTETLSLPAEAAVPLPSRGGEAWSTERPVFTPVPAKEPELILARFRLRARFRGAWLQTLWQEEGPSGSALISHAEAEMILSDRDTPQNEAAWIEANPALNQTQNDLREIESALENFPQSRLQKLAAIFGLNRAELDLFEACVAVAIDPTLLRLCAYLQDSVDRVGMSEVLAARLYGHGRCGIWPAESPLFRWELLIPQEASADPIRGYKCDPQLRDWIQGVSVLSEPLVGLARLQEALPALPSWPVKALATVLQQTLASQAGGRARLTLFGPRGSGKKHLAAAIAAEIGLPLLVIETDQIEDVAWRRVFLHAQRQGFLDRCALAWSGENGGRRSWPQSVVVFPLQFVLLESGLDLTPIAGTADQRWSVPSLSIEERAELWKRHVPSAAHWTTEALNHLAERQRVNLGDITHAARKDVQTAAEAEELSRQAIRQRLGSLAQPLETPFTWNDLVVAPSIRQSLEAFAFEAEHRARFWERPEARRLFPQGRGLLALFSGPSGTGKTMSAQVIAARLGQDLFRINVAQIVSKWVGETAKHFDFILNQAAEMDAVLFFDEADALFAKRSSEVREAQDRYANTDAAFLLQAIESFPGVAVLATNLKGNIDPAFFRRLRHVIEFSKPDSALQLALWENFIGELLGSESLTKLRPTLAALSTGIEATGAQIKYAVLGALFAAQQENTPIAGRHLLLGLERELVKEGRSIGPRDRERILKHG